MPEVIINGPDGRLECRYMPSEVPDAPTALILHPEPDKGGTMNNRVTYSLYKHFQARGFAVLRFNFRGVGRSQGEYDNGEGELSDAATAMDWLQAQNPASRQCWIAGFSFGNTLRRRAPARASSSAMQALSSTVFVGLARTYIRPIKIATRSCFT